MQHLGFRMSEFCKGFTAERNIQYAILADVNSMTNSSHKATHTAAVLQYGTMTLSVKLPVASCPPVAVT